MTRGIAPLLIALAAVLVEPAAAGTPSPRPTTGARRPARVGAQPAEGRTASGSLAARGGPARLDWCCESCGAGTGSSCTQAGSAGSCQGCFVSCPCGETSQGGSVSCHACSSGGRGSKLRAKGRSARPARSSTGSLAARIGTEELAYCCDSCPDTGSGSTCTQAGGSNSCLPNKCFLNCACGETVQGGGVTCHDC